MKDNKRWFLLIWLTAMWGSAFPFTTLALRYAGPEVIVAWRLLIAALFLVLVCLLLRTPASFRPKLWWYLFCIALFGNVLPFWLISWGQKQVSSGATGILISVTPLLTLMFSHLLVAGERLTGNRLAGFSVGFIGVVVLIGPEAVQDLLSKDTDALSKLAILGGAMGFAFASVLAKNRPAGDQVFAAMGVMLVGSLTMSLWQQQLPLAIVEWTPMAVLLIVTLGIFCTALATLVHFHLIHSFGPGFAALANYISPVWAIVLGVWMLQESINLRQLVAFSIILFGLALSDRHRSLMQPKQQ